MRVPVRLPQFWLPIRSSCFVVAAVVAIATAVFATARPRAQQVIGPNECVNCHDHDAERTWSQTGEQAAVLRLFPDRGKQAGHVNSLNQLEDSKAKKFAAAVGLTGSDGPYDENGVCVMCHAVDKKATNGVSCESCHGAAGAYVQTHRRLADQKPRAADAYQQDVKAGMRDIVGNPQAWVRQCMTCHIMIDNAKLQKAQIDKLIEAGHPSGDKFDVSLKFQAVALHFKSGKNKYTRESIAAVVAALNAPMQPPVPSHQPSQPRQPEPSQQTQTQQPPPQPEKPRPMQPIPVETKPPQPVPQQQPQPQPFQPPFQPQVVGGTPRQPQTSLEVAPSVADAEGQIIARLIELLKSNDTAGLRTYIATVKLSPPSGPDAALLDLQAQAIRLALEVLGRPSPPPPPSGAGKQ